MLDIGKAFTYVFEDEGWVTKILLGGVFVLLSFILIGIPFIIGYAVETVQNVMAGRPRPLPEWDQLGDKFTKGLVLAIALVIWSIPAMLLSWIGTAFQAFADSQDAGAMVAVGLLFSCVSGLYGLAIWLVQPAIWIKFAERPELGSAFKFNEIFSLITSNIGNYLVVLVLTIVTGIIAAFGFIALCVGILFTAFWAQLVNAHLYGQFGGGTSTAPVTTMPPSRQI